MRCHVAKSLRSRSDLAYGPEGVTEEIRERCNRELRILVDKHISAYFLICWDFVNWARQARHSGQCSWQRRRHDGRLHPRSVSMHAPVEYGLLFERFTDPDRSEYPDIDIDILP